MRRVLLTIALVLATAATALIPATALAATVDQGDQISDRTRDRAIDTVRPDIEPTDPPQLRCRGRVTDDGAPVVRCKWTGTQHPDAAGYKLVRKGGMEGRTVVFKTRHLDVGRFVDRNVEFKTRYHYKLVVVDEHGKRLEASRWNSAIVRNPDLERLRLRCEATNLTKDTTSDVLVPDTFDKGAVCAWRPATSPAAASYELWRLVRGSDHRELVAETGLDRTMVTDDVPDDAHLVVYAVLALDKDGEIVGRSNLSKVRFSDLVIDAVR